LHDTSEEYVTSQKAHFYNHDIVMLCVTMTCTDLYQTGEQSVLNTVKDAVMFEDFEVLCFVQEVLVRVLATHGVGAHLGLGHLLRDLTSGCVIVSCAGRLDENKQRDIPLLLPRMKL
jgi:hypothetical protein